MSSPRSVVHGVLSVVAVAVPASLSGMYTSISSRFSTRRVWRRGSETRYITSGSDSSRRAQCRGYREYTPTKYIPCHMFPRLWVGSTQDQLRPLRSGLAWPSHPGRSVALQVPSSREADETTSGEARNTRAKRQRRLGHVPVGPEEAR